MKKAQLEKKTLSGNHDKGTLLTQTSKANTKLYDEKQLEDDSEYESYLSTCELPVEVEIMLTEKEIDILLLEDNKETAILDTGCARSTGGEEWIESHIENLSQEDKLDVKRKEGKSFFRFGNGKRFKSLQLILMPVYIGGHRAIMAVDKISGHICHKHMVLVTIILEIELNQIYRTIISSVS